MKSIKFIWVYQNKLSEVQVDYNFSIDNDLTTFEQNDIKVKFS